MKKFVFPSILLSFSILMIISGISLNFIEHYFEDKKETLILVQSTEDYYHNIQEQFKTIHPYMLSMNQFFGLYYEEAIPKTEYYHSTMEKIENLKNNIDMEYQQMVSICDTYSTNITSTSCKEVVENYRAFSLSYTTLLTTYQEYINHCSNFQNSII